MATQEGIEDAGAVTVFFDGDCPLCAREVAFYRRLDGKRALRWRDVRGNAADLAREGVSQSQALARLHVRTAGGRIVTGVDAFVAIWERLPGFRAIAPIARRSPVRWVLARGYDWFAARRLRWFRKS